MEKLAALYAAELRDILTRYCNDSNGIEKCFAEIESFLRAYCPEMFADEDELDANGNSIGR